MLVEEKVWAGRVTESPGSLVGLAKDSASSRRRQKQPELATINETLPHPPARERRNPDAEAGLAPPGVRTPHYGMGLYTFSASCSLTPPMYNGEWETMVRW